MARQVRRRRQKRGRSRRQQRGQSVSLGKEWREFVAWCSPRRLKALPAHPWTVAAYVRWCEPRKRVPSILKSLREITRVHLLKCQKTPERHPTVIKTLRQIEARARTKTSRAGLFRAEDFAVFNDDTSEEPDAPKSSGTRRRAMRTSPRLVRRGAS